MFKNVNHENGKQMVRTYVRMQVVVKFEFQALANAFLKLLWTTMQIV